MLSTSIGGRCTLSSDCIDMRCQIVRNLDPLPNAITIVQIHLHPCAKPPAISYKATSPGRGTLIDGTFNKRRILSGVVGNATFEFTVGITQRPYGLSVKVNKQLSHIQCSIKHLSVMCTLFACIIMHTVAYITLTYCMIHAIQYVKYMEDCSSYTTFSLK